MSQGGAFTSHTSSSTVFLCFYRTHAVGDLDGEGEEGSVSDMSTKKPV